MNDEAYKKKIAKGLVRLRRNTDVLWAAARTQYDKIRRAATKTEPLSSEDIHVLRVAASVVLAQLIANNMEVEATRYLTPGEEDKYGGNHP